MDLKYVCVANGTNKESKKPYSKLAKVNEGTGYAYIDMKNVVYDESIIPLFTIKTFKTNIA